MMKLHEEFKEYETMWESNEHKPVQIRQGGRTYDIAKEEEFLKCVDSTAKAHRDGLAGRKRNNKLFSEEHLNAYEDLQKLHVARSLLDTLKDKRADEAVLEMAERITKKLETAYAKHPRDIKVVIEKNYK